MLLKSINLTELLKTVLIKYLQCPNVLNLQENVSTLTIVFGLGAETPVLGSVKLEVSKISEKYCCFCRHFWTFKPSFFCTFLGSLETYIIPNCLGKHETAEGQLLAEILSLNHGFISEFLGCLCTWKNLLMYIYFHH